MEIDRRHSFRRALAAAFPHTLPVLAGFLVLGIAYGMLMLEKGYGPEWSVLMSAVAFCGSMQFVAITLLTTAFQPLEALILSLLVNARHLFYGLSMLDKYKGFGKVKGFLIYTLCDETFSIVSSSTPPEGVEPKYFYLSISLLDYLYWVTGTFLGGMLGDFASLQAWQRPITKQQVLPRLGLLTLEAVTPPQWQVRILDERVDDIVAALQRALADGERGLGGQGIDVDPALLRQIAAAAERLRHATVVRTLRQKLGTEGALIETVRGVGYRMEESGV